MKSHAFARGFVRGLQYVTITVSLLVMSGCKYTVGPFVPANAQACTADEECPDGMTCKFPGVNTHAICMPSNELKAPAKAQSK